MNDERNAKIVKLWNSGFSAKEVAKQVGCTKNIVLGAVVKHRALGDITRPMIEGASERSKLGNRVKKRIVKMNRDLVARLREAWCNHREGKPFDKDLFLEAADRIEGAVWAVKTLSHDLETVIEKARTKKYICPISRQQYAILIEESLALVRNGEAK